MKGMIKIALLVLVVGTVSAFAPIGASAKPDLQASLILMPELDMYMFFKGWPSGNRAGGVFELYNDVASQFTGCNRNPADYEDGLFSISTKADIRYDRYGVGVYYSALVSRVGAYDSSVVGHPTGIHKFYLYDGNSWHTENVYSWTSRETYSHNMDLSSVKKLVGLIEYEVLNLSNIMRLPQGQDWDVLVEGGYGVLEMEGRYHIHSVYGADNLSGDLVHDIDMKLSGRTPVWLLGLKVAGNILNQYMRFSLSCNYQHARVSTIKVQTSRGQSGYLRNMSGEKVGIDYGGVYLSFGVGLGL